MRLTQAEWNQLRRGGTFARRLRRKSTGEIFWVDVKRSWDRLYYSCDAGDSWHSTATQAHEASLAQATNREDGRQ